MHSTNETSTASPFIPLGGIATIPPQGVRSHELVIEALAAELAYARLALDKVLEVFVHEWDTPDEVRQACPYWQAWNGAGEFLEELRTNWPHLKV